MTRIAKKPITIVAALLSLLLLISPFSPMILYASAATNEMEISISPVDSKGSTVAATSGVAGDNITITLPLVCKGQNISNIIVSPIVSENLDEFPFVIEKLDYTLKNTGTITKGTVCDFQYNFRISSQVTAGVKKIGFDVTYTDASNQVQSTVVYLYITVEESPTVDIPEYTISPKVIVQSFDLSKADIKAGEEFSINFTLLNTSVEQNIDNAVLKISDEANVISTASGTSGSVYLGKIEKSSDLVATMQLLASSSASSQVYPIGVTIEYEGEDGESYTSTDTIFISVTGATTPSEPTYSTTPKVVVQKFESNKASLTAGTEFELDFTLFNTSVEQNISNLVIKVSDDNGNIVPVNGSSTSMYVGSVTKNATSVVTVPMMVAKSATTQNCAITVTLEYEGEDGESYTSTDTIFVSVIGATTPSEPTYSTTPKVVVQKFESNKASLTAGTEFELDFTLFNTSVEQNISNLVIKVSDDNGNIVPVNGSSTSMYVGSITKNATSVVTVPMMVATSATTQNCAITVTLEYEGEDGESYTSTDTIFVSVIGATAPSEPTYSTTPKVVVQKFESNKASLTAGTEFELDFTLFNTSVEQNISNLVIKVSDDNGNIVPVNGSSTSMYVGSITKNATSVVTVPMMVAKSATTQNCAITVTLEYEGEDGESYTSTDTIFVSVIGATAPSEPTYSTTPKAIIQSVTIKKVVAEEEAVTEDNSIYGGDVIELTLVIFNTSAEQNIQNVLLKFNEESNSIIPIDGVVDSSYVGAISKGKTAVVSVKMRVLDSAESKTYPLNITMEYEGEDTQSYSVSQSAFITVKESANSQTTPTYSTTPKVIVKTASVNTESIIAGDSFEITLTLRNTSAEQDIHNLVVKISDESGVIIPVKGSSSSVYAGTISKESEQAIKLVMQAPSTAETKGYSLSVILEYEGDDKQSYTVNDSVVVQINQLPKLTIENPVLYDTPWLNQTCGTSLSIFNTGRSDIYNCLITIEGEGLTLETSYFGGIIKAGSSLESNFNIIPTKDGEVSGNIVVSYEDAMGNRYEQKCPIELFVNKDYTSTDTPSDVTVDKGGEQNNSWIIVVVVVVVILLCGVLVFVIIKNNRKRRLSDL